MAHKFGLHSALFFLTLISFIAMYQQINAYPFPHPGPRPYPYPIVQQANSQQNQYIDNFDKTQLKPPELEETIEEVQKILQKDPSLPRLTRGEIEELYEKVTREEYQKSVEAGDMGRADSMRALMLVLPFNTDNSTTDNLQELYTRPPVTKVIDGFKQHQPIKFITPDPNAAARTETASIGQLAATTYKPGLPLNTGPSPTTYHPPPPPPVMYKLTPNIPDPIYDFQPMTNIRSETSKPVQRFSSHYNAKNPEFLKLTAPKQQPSTIRPVADVLESIGIVGQIQSRNRFTIDDYYPAESAPQPVISSFLPLNGAEFDGLRGQSIAPKIKPDAYSSFKPLNIGEEIRVKPEVEDYLTRFGIVGGRKRKALKKSNSKTVVTQEQTGAGTELSSASLPAKNSGTELEKLLENLQELERLNSNRKSTTTTPAPIKTTKTTTTTTTPAPTEAAIPSLITTGEPIMIEPKKPRRRIDPHLDLNFAASDNQQPIQSNGDQLSKLLENLQELERLRLNPENVLKAVTPTVKAGRLATKPITTTTTTTTTTTSPRPPVPSYNEQLELQRLFKELQAFDQSNAKTTTTKKPPTIVRPNAGAQLDLSQLRKLLTDDNELERLYEQARSRVAPTTKKTTTTTTTTLRPRNNDFEFEQLQQYLAELDRARSSTTTTSTTSTTTTTTTPRPTTTLTPTKKTQTDDVQIQELINRVQQLERQNSNNNNKPKSTTESSLPFLGFTTRNIKASAPSVQATAVDYRVPSNDFAQLQQLYRQVQEADKASFTQVEISTAATASKHAQSNKRTEEFAQQLIDITNDTGIGSSLQDVNSNEFVQLQKLLSKVQELERVRINADGAVESTTPNPRPKQPSLVTAASYQSPNIQHPNTHIVYPEKPVKHKYMEFLEDMDDLKLDLPAYVVTPQKPSTVSKKSEAVLSTTASTEELHELAYAKPINPKQSKLDKDFEQYQEFFTSLEDAGERNKYRVSYDNMEPPMIEKTVTKRPPIMPKTVTKEPPRFVPSKKSQEASKSKPLSDQQQADLNELQKLLSNAQELEKLGVTLPKTLSDQIETKLSKTTETPTAKPTQAGPVEPEFNIYLERYGLKQKPSLATLADSSEKAAVFSLTTPKSVTVKPKKAATDSPLELPVFSATKIIEAAIKQAANKIGVPTEQPQGFRRRNDDITDLDTEDDDVADDADDMVGEFSEMNYQIAIPDINRMDEMTEERRAVKIDEDAKPMDISDDLTELQRLIGNLQELQKLNVSISSDMLRLADTKYLESFKNEQSTTNEANKLRRQSSATQPALDDEAAAVSPSTESSTTTVTSTESSTKEADSTSTASVGIPTTPTAPTHVNLGIGLDDSDTETAESGASSSSSSSSSSTSTTTEGTTTTEESRNGSLADLEASFGPDPNKEEPLPPKKKNGFYFLADWNSFLEVGDGDDQVVVRFSPKIGDPRLFLPVKIP